LIVAEVKSQVVSPRVKFWGNAVVLLSGGLDRAVSAFIARENIGPKGKLHALNILYGQLHSKESYCARLIVDRLEADLAQLDLDLQMLVNSSLTGVGVVPDEVEEGIPNTWVPQRNSIFLALAFAYAETVGANAVYIGVNSLDYSGYPDCRPEFIQAINKALNLASKRCVEGGEPIEIVAQLQYRRKSEIVLLGKQLGVPFEKTWSCYRGGAKACGQCPSCLLRLEGFKTAGIEDPLEYE